MFAEDELAGCDEAAQEASVINAPTPLTEATSHPAFTASSLPREIEKPPAFGEVRVVGGRCGRSTGRQVGNNL
jgi:hypothetical protein